MHADIHVDIDDVLSSVEQLQHCYLKLSELMNNLQEKPNSNINKREMFTDNMSLTADCTGKHSLYVYMIYYNNKQYKK